MRHLPRPLPVLALAAVLLVTACGAVATTDGGQAGAQDTGAARPVTVMLNWTPNAHHVGIYAALGNGWYEDAGLDVTVVEPADSGVEQAVAAGAADIGLAQAESLLPARAAGVPVVSVATVLPVNDSSLFSLAEKDIARPSDLEQTRYGGFGGALETEIISALMACDDADPATVEFVTLGNIDYLAGMQADQFDTAWVFSGWDALRASEVEGVGVGQVRFADYEDCVPNWYTPLVLTSETSLADDPSLVEDFLEVTARGYDLAVDDPAAAAAVLIDEVPELDAALVEASVAYYAPLFLPESGQWGEQDEAVWTGFAAFLTETGIIEGDVDGTAAFTNAHLSP